jgi:hypothetical protein
MSFDIGDEVLLTWPLTDTDGTPQDATTVVLTVTAPDGTASTPTVAHPSTGTYTATVTPDSAGMWGFRWQATGSGIAAEDGAFLVRRQASNVVPLQMVKDRLNKTLTSVPGDNEIQDMIDAAIAEYEEHVGPVTSGSLVPYYGGAFPRNVTDVVVTDADGNVVTFGSSNYIASPYLYWNEPLRIMGHGLSGLTPELFITYTAGSLPANHRELIIADVAGYFESTQRSDGAGQAGFPGEGGFEAAYAATPQVLFPRIRALGKSVARSAIA